MSFFSRFSPSNPENMEKRYRKDQVKTVERVFSEDIKTLREWFPVGEYNLKDADYQDPQDMILVEIGVNAIVHTEEVLVEQFPLLVNLIKEGREEVAVRSFERKSGGLTYRAIFATEDRFSGKTARILTNDIELLKSIANCDFRPPPPWIVWYELGPSSSIERQGDPDYWFNYVWDRFWDKLSLEEQAKYVADWREKTKSYISDKDWDDWVFLMRMRDPKYREVEDD
ncbi:hypothetical protein [Burkholderia sp. Ac-20353]|uniref:hypothetical protein n=1 Tax=Burkholderia sp. Ac-20353 TaxID=2703894 RepID=UPI00197B7148|nr:hypothetical protein [Burkholderia sp. Ac-20353]MBN3790637.1 hypothetical protein [Burkholderia sp. Ac-20353]